MKKKTKKSIIEIAFLIILLFFLIGLPVWVGKFILGVEDLFGLVVLSGIWGFVVLTIFGEEA